MIKKRMVVLLVGFMLGIGSQAFAEDENSLKEASTSKQVTSSSSELAEPSLIGNGQEKVQSSSPQISPQSTEVAGVFGTVPWVWYEETQELIFGSGEFPSASNTIQKNIETDPRLNGKKIKKITFTETVKAAQNSEELFAYLAELTTIEQAGLLDTSDVVIMNNLFSQSKKLVTIDVSAWNTSKVWDMSFMFIGAESLVYLDVGNWDTSGTRYMRSMFNGVSNLNKLDVSKWDTSNVLNMEGMFADTKSLSTIEIGSWDTSQTTTMNSMFDGSNKLTNLDVSMWDTSNVTTMRGMFANCSSLKNLDVSKWNTSNVTDMNAIFAGASDLSSLDVSNWNTASARDISRMYSGMSSLISIDMNNWDTSNVQSMYMIFNEAGSLSEVDISRWNTSNVASMSGMFAGASSLSEVDVSKWDMSNVKEISGMFYNTSSLTRLDVSNWDTANVEKMISVFQGASRIEQLDLSSWTMKNLTSSNEWNGTTDMFKGMTSLEALILGENTIFILDPQLPEKNDAPYTGAWVQEVGVNQYTSSTEFMQHYDGSRPGKYMREKLVNVTGVQLLPIASSLQIGEVHSVKAKVIPENATNQKVNYVSSNPSVATVTSDGIITGHNAGDVIITATTEEGGFQTRTTVTVTSKNPLVLDLFYLGIDSYVTGRVATNLGAKKAQLIVNNTVISTSNLSSTGSIELETNGAITSEQDQVEVRILDRKNNVLAQRKANIELKKYSVIIHPYTLYSHTLTGYTDFFHTEIALVVNGEKVYHQLLTITREFSLDVRAFIEYEDDEVEIIGYRYGEEITRTSLRIQQPDIYFDVPPYHVGDIYMNGKINGAGAQMVRLYVNNRRQQSALLSKEGEFQLLGISIFSPLDKVELAVYNQDGIEIARMTVSITD